MDANKIIKVRVNGVEYELQTTVDNVEGLRDELNALAQKTQVQITTWEEND